ncbi:MAG TPA: formate--phosphoribosylaminoimidazolecarboxamide ligase family protein [Thermoplasmata archaeon]|nr:formate--phosphoribosylaminoimidazolecarboxamide ligase family protein [Thermoplasmata archaeon]
MPLAPDELRAIARGYAGPVQVASIGSHSALDISDGAVEEGFRTIVLAQKGRDATYARYYRAERDAQGRIQRGCVDETWSFPKFSDAAAPPVQERLRAARAVVVPNRALSSYVPLDVLENEFRVPLVGSRALLRVEERTERENYYALLERAGIPIPKAVAAPEAIRRLTIVKLPHATRRLERGFFTVASPEEFHAKSEALVRDGVIRHDDLAAARLEEYVLGPVFNFNFFRSPLAPEASSLELLGVDERRESSLDGLVRLPAAQQLSLGGSAATPRYTVVGHGSLTVRESILERVFDLAERFIAEAARREPPGMIGPFTLQTCIDPDGEPVVFDVATRIGGGTNVHLAVGHAYANALWRRPMSTGRRIAVELKRAIDTHRLEEIVT